MKPHISPLVQITSIFSLLGVSIIFKNSKDVKFVPNLRHRYQGQRIKFKVNNNQIKMYDKRNNLLTEEKINNPKNFKVLKTKEDDGTG